MTQAYPLQGPAGRPRAQIRRSARFKTTLGKARDYLFAEIRRNDGTLPVLSTNLRLRNDGLPYSNQAQPEDRGVAVYFIRRGRQYCFACDQWLRIEDNILGIAKTIDALRGIARWGTGDAMERAFHGFEALPAPDAKQPWRVVLGFGAGVPTKTDIEQRFRLKAKEAHPDMGGSTEAMLALTKAREQALAEVA